MEYLTPVAVSIAVLLLLSLVYRPMLYVSIPALLIAALYTYNAMNLVLGYPTNDRRDLENPFLYLGHWSDDPTCLLAIPGGASKPRLYILDELNKQSEEQLQSSGERADQGEVTFGWFREGEYQRHNLNPADYIGPK